MQYVGKLNRYSTVSLMLLLVFAGEAFTQTQAVTDSVTDPYHKVVIAGARYAAGRTKKKLWGEHYRREWTTPVKVPIFNIDSAYGGLTPVEKGGGRQTKNLRLKNKEGHEFVLRSIDKNFSSAIPEIAIGTFIEDIVNDQVSTAHPYAAITIPSMAEAAGIYHTNPTIVFLPHSKTLGEFDAEFGNQLFLFEERPDDDQRHASYFGHSPDVISTEKLLQLIYASNKHYVDQAFYIRSRLFDMFLSDWGRHEDQWRWASFDTDSGKMYRPIPRDRDQAYTLFDGLLVSMARSSIQYGVESFRGRIKDIESYNFPARYMDRRFTNQLSLETWISIADDLKNKLSDQVIDEAISALPPEIYPLSGPTIAGKLKSRRNDLVKYAKAYYEFLAEKVDVPGSLENELFQITHTGGDSLLVSVYRLDANNNKAGVYYTRNFSNKETKEIRLYGVAGKDRYIIDGEKKTRIKIKIAGGPDNDSYETASGKSGVPVTIYDNPGNAFQSLKRAKFNLLADSSVNKYNYQDFKYDRQGIKKAISYNNKDRIFLRTGYYIERNRWRKESYRYRQDLNLNYSLIQNAFSAQYKAIFLEAVGSWNLVLDGEYDAVRDFHFPGIGNERKIDLTTRGFYRVRTREYFFDAGLNRTIGEFHQLGFFAFYQGFKLLYDNLKFISQYPLSDRIFKSNSYFGLRGEYAFLKLNDKVVPTKGAGFSTEAAYTRPTDQLMKPFVRLTGNFGFYLPLLKNLTLASKVSASTLTEDADFNQLNRLGGGSTFRGYLRFRFYGRSSFLNNNELQWTNDFKSYIMNGKAGFVAFFDNGRVWLPGEISNTWHISYGGGVLLAPFNKIVAVGTYGLTKEGNRINVRLGRLF